jgi:hypothetical protein
MQKGDTVATAQVAVVSCCHATFLNLDFCQPSHSAFRAGLRRLNF